MKLISDFAERLRIALNSRNMKATELSELSNINKSTISQYLSKEYENIKMTTSTLMFNGRPASENDKIELERILKEFFVKALLKKRADEENDKQKKKRNSKID